MDRREAKHRHTAGRNSRSAYGTRARERRQAHYATRSRATRPDTVWCNAMRRTVQRAGRARIARCSATQYRGPTVQVAAERGFEPEWAGSAPSRAQNRQYDATGHV